MKQKIFKIDNCVGNILHVTKDTIKQTQSFYDYYIQKDNSLYQKQLPILIQKANFQSIAISRKEKEKNIELIQNKFNSQDNIKLPLSTIRHNQIRSKKLPPLCPFYNKKGELLRSYIKSTKVTNNQFLKEKFRETSPLNNLRYYKTIRLNKSGNSAKNIDFNKDFQKDFFYEDEYSNLTYDDYKIFGNKDIYIEYIKEKIDEYKKKEIKIKNNEYKKEKIFDKNANKKPISISIDSLNIKIYEISENENKSVNEQKEQKEIFEYYLPFEYLFLFYFKGEEKFKIILSQIIQYDNINDKFILNSNIEKKIKDILNYSQNFNKDLKNIKKNKYNSKLKTIKSNNRRKKISKKRYRNEINRKKCI